jgi:phosphoribosylformylglycinamidine cyclo-ligase
MDNRKAAKKKPRMRATTYAEAGVDAEKADECLMELVQWVKKSESLRDGPGRPVMDIGYFANVIRLSDTLGLAISTDGVGTKLLLAQQMNKLDGVGIDCIAMNVNDVLCVGAEPLAMVDYLAIEEPDPEMLSKIGESLYRGAVEARIVIPGGELAQVREMLRGSVKGRAFDLVGTCVGTVELDRIIVGEGLADGDAVIGLASSGLHSNGFTLARKVIQQAGWSLDRHVDELGRAIGDALLAPTVIYVPHVKALRGAGIHPKALIHVSGDGLLNLTRVTSPASFNLDTLPRPQPIFGLIQKLGSIPREEMYSTFNMGIGFCVVCSEEESELCLEILRRVKQDAWRIGEVALDGRREVRLPGNLVGKGKRFRGKSREPDP